MKILYNLFFIFLFYNEIVYCSSKGKTKITKPPAPKEILPPK